MRPLLILTLVGLTAVAALGQQPFSHTGQCFSGCGPFVPLVVTPEISLEQVSPNPVGATNATAGLSAGATNSTLSEISASTSSTYTEPVWIRGGGAPLISPEVHLNSETVGREGRPMMHEGGPRDERAREEGTHEKPRPAWMYIVSEWHPSESPAEAASGKTNVQHGHVYGNDDVTRQNDKNGNVRYRGQEHKI